MIARISTGGKPSGAVGYNEQKVMFGDAHYLGGFNSINLENQTATIAEKVEVMERFAGANPRISKPTFHVALSFHPDEKLNDDTLKEVGQEYMERMGYGTQPYLIYRHTDTLHPHIHIVSVSVDARGKKISDSQNFPRSNAIRKELEIEYKLIKAEDVRPGLSLNATLSPDAIHYGKQQTKQAIGNVLQTALKDYSFSGNEDLSVFLSSYNIQLNRLRGERVVAGETKSWAGVTFQLTNGIEAVSPAIKASSFSFAPTQQLLDKRFESGTKKNARNQPALLGRIDAGRGQYATLTEGTFLNTLRAADIRVVDTGKEYLYIDQKRRSVFSEKSLPPAYHRSTLFAQFGTEDRLQPTVIQQPVIQQRVTQQRVTQQPVEQEPVAEKEEKTVTQTAPPPAFVTTTTQTTPQADPIKPKPLTEAELIQLGKLVSPYYQDYKKENSITYESQLIRAFPFAELQQRMILDGQPADKTQLALREFERYKTGELPVIEDRERDYFQQTSQAVLRLSSTMPLNTGSRVQFLGRMGLELTRRPELRQADNPNGEVLSSRENPAYGIVLNEPTRHLLSPAPLPDEPVRQVAYPIPFSREERQLYTALALDKPIPANITHDKVVYSQLEAGLSAQQIGPVSRALNENTVQQVSQLISQKLSQLAKTGSPVELTRQAIIRAFKEHKTNIYPAADGFAAGHPGSLVVNLSPLPAQLSAVLASGQQTALRNTAADTTTDPTRVAPVERAPTAPPAGLSQADRQQLTLRSYDVLSADYRRYLAKTNVVYESSLLGASGQLPTTRLTNTLREAVKDFPGGSLPESEVRAQVERFIQSRTSLIDTLVAAEQKQFDQRAGHYLTLLTHPGITPAQRIRFLSSVGIDLIESGTGKQFLADSDRPMVKIVLSPQQRNALHKEAGPDQQSPLASGSTIGPVERTFYEAGLKNVHPSLMTSPQAGPASLVDPASQRFDTLHAPRLKALLSEPAWHELSPRLNRNSVDYLLPILSKERDTATALTGALRQHGYLTMVDSKTQTVRIGHYLTNPRQWRTLPASQYPALMQSPARIRSGVDLTKAVTHLSSERGSATVQLANALRLGKDKQVSRVVDTIVRQAKDLRPYENNPGELLHQLSQTTGPLRLPAPQREPVREQSGKSDLEKTLQELNREAGNGPGLLDTLAKGMDTRGEGKKTHLEDEPRRPRQRRK